MGSIFDAMNRASRGGYERRLGQRPADPPADGDPPDGPAPDEAEADAKQDDPPAADPGFKLAGDTGEPPDPIPAPGDDGPITAPLDAHQQPSHAASNVKAVDDRLVALSAPSSLMCEEYRAIRTSILARHEHNRHLVHTITSATPQEGKTFTTLNLGLTFAELRNRRSIVVEADLRLPQFAKLLQLSDQPGLIGILSGTCRLSETLIEVGDTNLHMMVAGGRANNRAVQLLHSNRMADLLKVLRDRYDHVIIDTPPVVELADAGILGAMSDDVLMIVRMGRTPEPLVRQAIRTLNSYNAHVAGLVATAQMRNRGRYYYRYGYRYRYRYHYQYTNRKAA